ncbi:hypothetical protein Tco_1049313 [Tanacetum coccineum]
MFLNSLPPEWVKYVINVRFSKNLANDHYDTLFDHLQQYKGIVNASRAKRDVKTHDPLALVVNTYERDAICDDQEDSLTIEMMLLARVITQQMLGMVIDMQEGQWLIKESLLRLGLFRRRLEMEMFRGFYEPWLIQEMVQMFSVTTAMPKVIILENVQSQGFTIPSILLNKCCLQKKMKLGLFSLMNKMIFLPADASKIDELEDLSATVCMMARIQQADNDSEKARTYDSTFISKHEQHEIIKPTVGNDQINSDIIFDDPNVEVNDGKVEDDKNAHDQ